MQKPATWRELLATLIHNPVQRQYLVEQLEVNPLTLSRWINGETAPRPRSLRRLLELLPEQRSLFLELLEAEFGVEFVRSLALKDLSESFSPEIAGSFYTRVLRTLATLPAALSFSSLCDLILEQALKQLDAQRLGMAIMVSLCLPPASGHIVRSLLESLGRGTPPWNLHLEQDALLLGVESLTGYAVTVRHLVTRQRLGEEEPSLLPGYRDRWEKSAVAAPIARKGYIGGCLLVSSTQPDYFSPVHQQLIQSYADLLALIFEPQDFFDPEYIRLGVLPPQTVQRTYLAEFQRRLLRIMSQAARDQQSLTVIQAQQLVWQQFEDELLQMATSSEAEADRHLSHQKELSHDN